ncbi:hypothetical protein K443DRAFT_671216 [Laccaria amethystina LaAM-08-1]|uniref:Transmembrane protein 19 n=1 Tax=Laccaria amethystina LaAM-08-1 TaxID=1095629 RepID=A0A0C9YHU2_9AGAR|nr:hypothetical protein K443DRAFT_671216 [Laccaria amethystina LaAM-08-1]
MAGGIRAFGVALIGFYLIGSWATKYGKEKKTKLEESYQEGGNRTGWQVLSNSAAAVAAAFTWNSVFVPGSIHANMARILGLHPGQMLGLTNPMIYDGAWCPLDASISNGWSRALVLAALGHFACCLGDTLGSELGILSDSPPRLITTFKRVPPGTNGAMSLGGTLASVVGGAIVGSLMGISLIVENVQCSPIEVLTTMIVLGMLGGGIGSLIDSVMGATIQRTRYSTAKKMVLQDGSTFGGDIKIISGWNLLTNNQVNLLSSVICAALLLSA